MSMDPEPVSYVLLLHMIARVVVVDVEIGGLNRSKQQCSA